LFFERGSNNGGSILDFEKMYNGAQNLGYAKKAVRPMLGYAIPAPAQHRPKLRKSTPDNIKIANLWDGLEEYNGPYLKSRGITMATQNKFDIRIDDYGNACFKYQSIYDTQAHGIEKRNAGIKARFEEGSQRKIWMQSTGAGEKTVIFTESPIDAMSYEQLHGSKLSGQRIYIATGGQVTKGQLASIEKLMIDTKAHAITALDNDMAGRDMTASINSVLPVKAEVAVPVNKDWNEDLQAELTAQAQAQALAEEARLAKEQAHARQMEPEREMGD
jgi:hypothetical protein